MEKKKTRAGKRSCRVKCEKKKLPDVGGQKQSKCLEKKKKNQAFQFN